MQAEEEIKERFVKLVKDFPLTQEEIAKRIGCEFGAFRQYCTGRSPLPLRYWKPFCALMGISADYLLSGHENRIIRAYNGLSEDDKPLVDRFLFPKGSGAAADPPLKKSMIS